MTRIFIALAITVALGLLSRLYPIGWFVYDKSLGDVLYAVAAYLVLALVLPRKSSLFIATMALTFCLAIENFKNTGIPERYGRFTLVRWVLGTTFSWHDIGCYIVGVGIIAGVDVVVLRPRRRRR
jgi:hypothetical protein